MSTLEANYVIRNESCDYDIDSITRKMFDKRIHQEEDKLKRFAIEYCYKDFDTDEIEYGLDYEYFDNEQEANEFIENFNESNKFQHNISDMR